MEALYTAPITTQFGEKSISVYATDILNFDEPIDILTTSAHYHSYAPVPQTMFEALDSIGISVHKLAKEPLIDLRELCNIWLSASVDSARNIQRIGCIEMSSLSVHRNCTTILHSIKAYFQMLDIASTYNIPMKTVALPLLGTGSQHISSELMLYPILNECYSFLKRNPSVERICFIERSQPKAFQIAQMLSNSYTIASERSVPIVQKPSVSKENAHVFISYSSLDRNVADNLYSKLEANGIKAWYAPKDMHSDYASQIAIAISKSTHFIVILSKNSMKSQHVLNEIDLAFKKLPDHIHFVPLRIDDSAFEPAFDYYLSRQHWTDAYLPPLEMRLTEFIDKLKSTL